MALKPCRECKAQISTEATTCPHCGKKGPTSSALAKVFGLGIIATSVFVCAPMFVGHETQAISDHVADDMVAQYNVAKSSGNRMDACVHAGVVKAAFIQAKDPVGTAKWDKVEHADCSRAGVAGL